MLKNYVALKDVGPVPSGAGHQENLKNLKHLVSISDRGRVKVRSIKNGWAPCRCKGVGRGRKGGALTVGRLSS